MAITGRDAVTAVGIALVGTDVLLSLRDVTIVASSRTWISVRGSEAVGLVAAAIRAIEGQFDYAAANVAILTAGGCNLSVVGVRSVSALGSSQQGRNGRQQSANVTLTALSRSEAVATGRESVSCLGVALWVDWFSLTAHGHHPFQQPTRQRPTRNPGRDAR